MTEWSTACIDWEERIVEGRSLIPFDPLFPEEAAAALEIFKALEIVDSGGLTFGSSRAWILDFVAAIFGAFDRGSGRQLIRYFLLLISKKNAKSTLAAGIMITALIRNWRPEGEYCVLAPSKEVANNTFQPAMAMVNANLNLRALLHISEHQRTITHRNTGATLKVVAADTETVGGKKTIGLLVEELHLFGHRAGAGSMLREAMGGLASRPEGWVIYLTTQSDKPPRGVWDQTLREFRGVRDGKVTAPRSLAVMYEFPEAMVKAKAYEDPANWHVTNPNLGASVDLQFLRDQWETAQRAGKAQLADFYAKHLNVQIGQGLSTDGWAGAEVWERGIEVGLTLDEILDRSEVVAVGIDGGGLDDLLGIGVIGREKLTKRWLAWSHAFISDIGQERRKANFEAYQEFIDDGDLEEFVYKPLAEGETDFDAPNIAYIVALVRRIKEMNLLAQVGVDAAGIGSIVDALATIDVTQANENLDAVGQGIRLMNAIKTVEIKLASYIFRHGGSRMLSWCVGNLKVAQTRTAMMVARDEAGFGKVDPIMAIFNAAHLMSLNPEPPAPPSKPQVFIL
jgi:phage terminase large subunit-like protein